MKNIIIVIGPLFDKKYGKRRFKDLKQLIKKQKED